MPLRGTAELRSGPAGNSSARKKQPAMKEAGTQQLAGNQMVVNDKRLVFNIQKHAKIRVVPNADFGTTLIVTPSRKNCGEVVWITKYRRPALQAACAARRAVSA
jgi:hypothetical protein